MATGRVGLGTTANEHLKHVLNEILPLVFVSLKFALSESLEAVNKDLLLIEKLDDFLIQDEEQTKLLKQELEQEGQLTMEQYMHLETIHKQLEFIARMYTMDSRKYAQQSEYWLSYAAKVAGLLVGAADVPERAARLKARGLVSYDMMLVHPHHVHA